MNFLYKLKIFFLRVVGYEKPLRVAFLKYLSVKYKTFKPHYETVLLESCKEAKKSSIIHHENNIINSGEESNYNTNLQSPDSTFNLLVISHKNSF